MYVLEKGKYPDHWSRLSVLSSELFILRGIRSRDGVFGLLVDNPSALEVVFPGDAAASMSK